MTLAGLGQTDLKQLEARLEQLKQKGELSPKEQRLHDMIALLIEAAKSGNSSIFNRSLNGGSLKNLLGGLSGGRSLNRLFGNGGGRGGGIDWQSFKPWSEGDRAFLEQSLRSDPEHFRDQIHSWKQGQEGNCAAVAAIKASVDRYDNRVLDSISPRADGGYALKMQDGFELSLSQQELSMAKTASNFRGEEGSKAYPQVLYAAMAKRAVMQGDNNSFANALWDLNDGDNPWRSARLLGLEKQTVQLNPNTLNGQDSVVAWSNRHAVFVDKNRDGSHTSDHYGRGYRFNGTDTNGRNLVSAYTFKPRTNLDTAGLEGLRAGRLDGGLTTPRAVRVRTLGPTAWAVQRP